MSRRRGRPTSLTPQLREEFLTHIRDGASGPSAAVLSGISQSTYHRWMGDPRREYREFRESIERERAALRTQMVAAVYRMGLRSPRAALGWLWVHGGPEWRGMCGRCGSPVGEVGSELPANGLSSGLVGRSPLVRPKRRRW